MTGRGMDPDKRSSPDEGSFSEAVRDLADEKRRKLGEHPTAEVLVALHEGRLSAAEAESLRDHLALCPECRELLRDLGAFGAEPPAGSPRLEDVDVEAAWQGLRSRLGGGEDATSEEAPSQSERRGASRPLAREERTPGRIAELEPRRKASGWGVDRNRLALAASLLLAVAGFAWGGYNWRQMLDQAKPKANVPLIDLFPEQDLTRGSEDSAKVPAGVDDFVLVITPPEPRSSDEYDLEIARDEKVVYAGRLQGVTIVADPVFERDDARLAPGVGGSLTLVLTRRDFPAGSYQAQLFDVQDGRRGEKVADYRFVVEGS